MKQVKGLGNVGKITRKRVREERERQNLNLAALARRVTALGRPMSTLAVQRIEEGARRVDVDDLIALALALDIAPIALLAPAGDSGDETFAVADDQPAAPLELIWPWMRGEKTRDPFGGDDHDFARRSLPAWFEPEGAQAQAAARDLQAQVRMLQQMLTEKWTPGTEHGR